MVMHALLGRGGGSARASRSSIPPGWLVHLFASERDPGWVGGGWGSCSKSVKDLQKAEGALARGAGCWRPPSTSEDSDHRADPVELPKRLCTHPRPWTTSPQVRRSASHPPGNGRVPARPTTPSGLGSGRLDGDWVDYASMRLYCMHPHRHLTAMGSICPRVHRLLT